VKNGENNRGPGTGREGGGGFGISVRHGTNDNSTVLLDKGDSGKSLGKKKKAERGRKVLPAQARRGEKGKGDIATSGQIKQLSIGDRREKRLGKSAGKKGERRRNSRREGSPPLGGRGTT